MLIISLNDPEQNGGGERMNSDSNIQLKHCINDLKASMCSLKETLISHSYNAKIVETQMQNFSL